MAKTQAQLFDLEEDLLLQDDVDENDNCLAEGTDDISQNSRGIGSGGDSPFHGFSSPSSSCDSVDMDSGAPFYHPERFSEQQFMDSLKPQDGFESDNIVQVD